MSDKGAQTRAPSMGEEMGKGEDGEEDEEPQRGASPTACSPGLGKARSLNSEL